MVVLTNQKLEDLVARIGDHEKRTVEISFPAGENISLTQDELQGGHVLPPKQSYIWSALSHGIYDLEVFGAHYGSWGTWIETLNRQIGEAYGRLQARGNVPEWLSVIPSDEFAERRVRPEAFHEEFGFFIGEALGNAMKYGNKWDAGKKIVLDSYLGRNGIVYSVRDEGGGFDVSSTLSKLRAGDDTYHSSHSVGTLLCYSELSFSPFTPRKTGEGPGCFFAYNKRGNQWMFAYDFDKGRYAPEGFDRDAVKMAMPVKKVVCWDLDGTLGEFADKLENPLASAAPVLNQPLEIRHGIKELLDTLCSKGYMNFVTTTATLEYTHAVLRKTGLRRYFQDILPRDVVHNDDVAHGKLYRPVADWVGFSNEQAAADMIVIGDGPGDRPMDLDGVVFLEGIWSLFDSRVTALMLEKLDTLGGGNYRKGFEVMHRNAREIRKKGIDDFCFPGNKVYDITKGLTVRLGHSENQSGESAIPTIDRPRAPGYIKQMQKV